MSASTESKKKTPLRFSEFSERSNGTVVPTKNNTHKNVEHYKYSAEELGTDPTNLWTTAANKAAAKEEFLEEQRRAAVMAEKVLAKHYRDARVTKVYKDDTGSWTAVICSIAGVCILYTLGEVLHYYAKRGGKSHKRHTRKLRK
jgi:hypothetical protein